MTENNTKTWDPLRGCRKISPGCDHCCAERQAARLSGPGRPYEGLVAPATTVCMRGRMGGDGSNARVGPRWTGATAGPDRLDEPLRWRKPHTIFVCSMGDLFYEGHTNEQIAAVFGVMAAAWQHTFIVLTKRPQRAVEWFEWISKHPHGARRQSGAEAWAVVGELSGVEQQAGRPARALQDATQRLYGVWTHVGPWPLSNVWMGVSVEDQQRADERLPHMERILAAVRFVSYEPALEAVDFRPWLEAKCQWRSSINHGPDTCSNEAHYRRGIDWLICGGESGPGARPLDLAWARSARKQCLDAGTAFFFKQAGARPFEPVDPHDASGTAGFAMNLRARKGGDINEFPADLRIREYPHVG